MKGLFRKIQDKRKIKKLFRIYGKTVYQARVDYVKNFLPETASETRRVSGKPRLKTAIVITLILAMLMAIVIVGAKAFDIPLPTFSFNEQGDHSEVVVNLEGNVNDKEFLEIGHVPEGYTHVAEESFADTSCESIYVNAEEKYLYIEQYKSKETIMNIDNENCERYVKSVAGIDVEVFSYEDGRQTYLFVKNQIYVVIQGYLSDAAMQDIIQNLR